MHLFTPPSFFFSLSNEPSCFDLEVQLADLMHWKLITEHAPLIIVGKQYINTSNLS